MFSYEIDLLISNALHALNTYVQCTVAKPYCKKSDDIELVENEKNLVLQLSFAKMYVSITIICVQLHYCYY